MEEEIDLRPYIRAIFRAWYWIVGAAVVTAVVAFLVSSRMPETYEAEAVVAIVRERTTVSFNTSIETQEDILGSRDVNSRREALIALVTSNDVAEQVLAEVGDLLAADERSAADLLKKVNASNAGDLIVITVSHEDPQAAAEIANVWARIYESHVNMLYMSRTSTNPETVAAQVAVAQAAYDQAQTELETFRGENRVTLLENEIKAQEALLTNYLTARSKIQSAPSEFQANARQQLLAHYYADLSNIELWLADAQALRDQVQADAGSAAANVGNALALIALRNRIFGGSEATIILQVDLVNPAEAVQPADVEAVIEVLTARRAETEAQIESLSISFAAVEPAETVVGEDHPINQRIEELNANLLQLQAELAAQTAQDQELTQVRDLAWETYQALAKKEAEVTIAVESTGTEVRLASRSAVPDEPAGRSGLIMAVVAAVVGGMLAVFGVTAVYWWREADMIESPPEA